MLEQTERQLAKARYDEATRVLDAYASQVSKRREKWRTAVPADVPKRRKDLSEAVKQHARAKSIQDSAWRTWHALNKESMGTSA